MTPVYNDPCPADKVYVLAAVLLKCFEARSPAQR